ncbi:MAG TPA: CBS domain-containing protein [Methylomirabilota bacterium]|nr:CBS domain-containing protein [Methylomirabilota bacterium]
MEVRELMQQPVLTIDPDASAYEAVTRMCAGRVRHLPVLGGSGDVVGVVTDRDLQHHLFAPGVFDRIGTMALERLLREVRVATLMSAPAIVVPATADLTQAAALMRRRRVGALPVVENGRVIGILTETDLLRHISAVQLQQIPGPDIVVAYP